MVKVKITGLLNIRQLAKPCMLAAMTAAPLRGFLVIYSYLKLMFIDRYMCNYMFVNVKNWPVYNQV